MRSGFLVILSSCFSQGFAIINRASFFIFNQTFMIIEWNIIVSPLSIIPYHFYFVVLSILHQIGYDQFVHAVWYSHDFSFILLLSVLKGMSDLLSPILFVMEDESQSFWCFVALMERLGPNFNRDQNGMHSQLFALSKVSLFIFQLLVSPTEEYA